MARGVYLKDKNGTKCYPAPYWPIGSIYISVNNTNPSNYFGGTWEALPQDYYLITAPITQTNIGKGGSWYTNETVLTTAQMPSHNHILGSGDGADGEIMGYAPETNPIGGANHYYIKYAGVTSNPVRKINVKYTGGNQGHNHFHQPPYYQVYAWRRVS